MNASTRGGQGAGAGTLPDVNAETYPYERVQQLLDETVSLSLAAVPDESYRREATLTPSNRDDWFGLNGGYGIDFESTLHRFEAVPRFDPYTGRLTISQPAGDGVGRLHCRCMFAPSSAEWQPGADPYPTIFDPWRSQRIVTADCEFTFGRDVVHAYAIGRTYPVVADGEPFVLLGAVGNFMRGTGQFEGLEGTFVLTGRITASLGFAGSVSCRIVDPEGRIRTDREMPANTGAHDPFPHQTFIVMRGAKRDRTVRTTYGPPPGPNLVSLITPSQIRAILTEPVVRDRTGLRVGMTIGPVVASMEADVSFNIAAPPGTAEHPVPFTTKEIYTFIGDDGRSCGTINAEVTDGVSFGLRFPAAPRQGGVRFAGFGPITGGTGQFEGVQGVLTVNSVIGIAPHALSLLHVLQIVDREGVHRSGARRRTRSMGAARTSARLAPELEPLAQRLTEWSSKHSAWRRQIRDQAEATARAVTDWYDRHLHIGEFHGRRIDCDALTRILEAPVDPLDMQAFNAYRGPAKGYVRYYEPQSKREVEAEKTMQYVVWADDNVVVDGRILKPITASSRHHIYPTHLPNLCDGVVDVSLRAYRDDTGMTRWTELFQKGRQQRTAVGYALPHPGETLWFERDVSAKDMETKDGVWRVSHEWTAMRDHLASYCLVGFVCEIDLDTGEARPCGRRFWRAQFTDTRNEA